VSGAPAERFGAVRALFEEIVDLAPAARAARLASAAERDPDLAARVAALLAADAGTGALLDAPAGVAARDLVADWLGEAAVPDAAGTRIGPWRLVAPLGRGGMGEVWSAERADGQFEQAVALKLLKRGMDSEEVLARFLRERQILARLTHPGIARLLDGGLAPDGRPYFVLERVDGRPITEHARRAALPVAARIRLILAACDAVDSAHRQLVVHRDLKPSNVLVTAAGELKLLDFGIAKLLDEASPDGGATALGLRAMTPAYAAPEQILGEPVTTATDVYSLGVVLHELLTGRLPHRRSTTSAAALVAEVERESPPRLSHAVAQLDAADFERLGLPDRERRHLERRVRGDLDTILAHALDRAPERRYASARELADDLVRHLEGRPVRARPQSRRYRAARFVARHRAAVAAAALVLFALVGGLSAALWQGQRAAANARESAANARRAERTKEFLVSLFQVADPTQSGGETVTARALLDQGAQRLESELADEPAVRADLLAAVARIQTSLGLLDAAERSTARALELRADAGPEVRAALEGTLGAIRIQQGDLDEAGRLLERSLAALEAAGADPLEIARVKSDAAQVRFWRRDFAATEAMERAAYETFRAELGEGNVETALHLRNLGVILDDAGRVDEAEAAYRRSQAVLERNLGPEHPHLGQSYLSLGVLLEKRGRLDEAEALLRRALALRRRTLGDRHVQTGQTLQLLAHFMGNHDRLDEAESAGREALGIFRAANPKHFEVGKCLNGLAIVAEKRGDSAAAEKLYREALANFEESLGRDHPFYWWTTINLANSLAALGRFADSEPLHRAGVAALERVSGAESADAQWAYEMLAKALRRQGRAAEADAEAARAAAIAAKLPSG
jgi:serine/threonine-protein kinase